MDDIWNALTTAITLVLSMDDRLMEIILLSLKVSLSAVVISALIGFPLGAALALFRFPGRKAAIIGMNVLMGLPPVVAGLIVYLMLSRSGPFGVFGLLFTPAAMIIAQVILVVPIITALTRQVFEELSEEYDELLASLGAGPWRRLSAVMWDGRYRLLTALLAGFGRASAEVGAVMIVGGNIDHVTRVMTTAIALEASKGDLAMALGLGVVLIALSLGINLLAYMVNDAARARQVA